MTGSLLELKLLISNFHIYSGQNLAFLIRVQHGGFSLPASMNLGLFAMAKRIVRIGQIFLSQNGCCRKGRTYFCTVYTTMSIRKKVKKKEWLGWCAGLKIETQYRAQRYEEELNFAAGGINDPALSVRKTYRAPWTSASTLRILNSACTVPFKSMNSKYLQLFIHLILRLRGRKLLRIGILRCHKDRRRLLVRQEFYYYLLDVFIIIRSGSSNWKSGTLSW